MFLMRKQAGGKRGRRCQLCSGGAVSWGGTVSICQKSKADGASLGCVGWDNHAEVRAFNAAPDRVLQS